MKLEKLKVLLKKVSDFFRLIDDQGKLSITNVAVYVVLVKIAMVSEIDLMDAGILFVALLNYSGKKVLNKIKEPVDMEDPTALVEERISKLQDKVNSIAMAMGITRKM